MDKLITIEEASKWASNYLKNNITESNISYLIQYGRVKKYNKKGQTALALNELKQYYQNNHKTREDSWKKELGEDLNWKLSFDNIPERERTKHVHRLHQYKGKFIPQLVEYFLDNQINGFKKEVFFRPGDIVLDPFCGSGTTLIQANELGMHSIGVDISKFNCFITRCKLQKYDIEKLQGAIDYLIEKLKNFQEKKILEFAEELYKVMCDFNYKNFPNYKYKYEVNRGKINEEEYSKDKEKEFLKVYRGLVKKYKLNPYTNSSNSFLHKWYIDNVTKEMNFLKNFIEKGKDKSIVNILKIILSRKPIEKRIALTGICHHNGFDYSVA